MASKVLYPPVVDSYMPAFVAGEGARCRVYFSLSKFNSSSDFKSVHISVIKQGSGTSIVNKENNEQSGRYRATGIIVPKNDIIGQEGENLYYVDILSEDIQNKKWTVGNIYKVQLRLSSVNYNPGSNENDNPLAVWLQENGDKFSEWSTVCTIKAIGVNNITIPALDYSTTTDSSNIDKILATSTLNILGSYSNKDKSEKLFSYKMKLYEDNVLIEESDVLYSNQYLNSNEFSYSFKTELKEEKSYTYKLDYETNNKYTGTETVNFSIIYPFLNALDISIITAETGAEGTTVYEEEEEGRVGLLLKATTDEPYFGNLCIRRASALDNYKTWEDIKIFTVKGQSLNQLEPIYDYTIVSGVDYKYGIQGIDEQTGNRTILKEMSGSVKREFNYSFLLGENNQQLKLKFDTTISGYKTTVKDTQVETIGSKYPFITRNGNIQYKTFSLESKISYNMDENNLFLPKDFIGREPDGLYDYTYEREFREKVLEFINDDKPKLFKSPTEGNILIRLTNAQINNFEASLSRLIGSFNATATEIDEASIKSYNKYNPPFLPSVYIVHIEGLKKV